jgi:hypothetical protein
MSGLLRITVPAQRSPLFGEWIGCACAFLCFVAAGQMLTTRVSEVYDMLNVDLSVIQQFTAQHPVALAVAFVALGALSLGATRVRGPRAALVQGVVTASALVPIVVVLLSAWIGISLRRHGCWQ